MAEKKEVSAVQETKDNQIATKKATTGAWWKSTSSPDSTAKKTAENSGEAQSRSTNRRKRATTAKPKKQSRPSAGSRKKPAKVAEVVSTETKETSTVGSVQTAVKEGTSGVPETDGAPSALQPPKKRAPRSRKGPAKAAAGRRSKTGAAALKEVDQDTTVIPADEGSSEEVKEPAVKKKTPRRRGRPRKTVAKDTAEAENRAEDAAADEAVVQAGEDVPAQVDLKENKAPRRKPGRRKKTPVKKGVDETEGQKDMAPTLIETDGLGQGAVDETAVSGNDSSQREITEEEGVDETASVSEGEQKKEKDKPVIKLLINADEPEECRLALLEDGRLESIHVATSTRTQTKNNIYKAKIVAIEPNLQAAFVDYGTEKNGFLPFSEIHPEYYKENVSDRVRSYIDQHQWKKLSISDVVEKGREVLVQVVKEEIGKKGANMTTYLSLPGRCVVLMPGSDSTGISRKISGEEKRNQLRDYILGMNIPEGIGWIVRTASNDITKAALARDVNYLIKLWDDVKGKGQELNGVGLVYQDHDHVLRFLREHFDPDIQEILVDNQEALNQVTKFVELLPARQRKVRCKLHRGARPIFNQYSIEDQIESIYQPKVNLPSGGSIVIDPTEALVAIDVNSGSTQKGQNFEETIFLANLEAAVELTRQLRLRDLGGLVVVDFIDMRSKKNIREVERQVKVAMKRDRAKVDISRISKFGLMQISRQKLGAPIEAGNYRVCSHCRGRGVVRSVETLALYYLRRIHTGASRKMVVQIECRFPLDVAQYLLNNKRQELRELETKYASDVVIIADPLLKPADHEIIFHKAEKDESIKKRS